MTATGTASKNGNQLNLIFGMTHRMAMAVIEMPKTVYKFTDNADIPDYIVTSSVDFTDSSLQPYGIAPGTYRCIVNPAQSAALTGSYDNGKKEFAFTLSCIVGSYKTYRIDGATLTEKQTTLRMGDYFCKNGDNNWYIIPQEATPDGNVIGIVFYAGQHETDEADYSESGIGQSKCHGYVVALTDVHNDNGDRLRWEWGPNQQYEQKINVSTSRDDWNGYSNNLKLHEFVSNNTDWEMKHFPAALACDTYGNRTLDMDGNPTTDYDWQQPLAAPSNSSGWFLPSCDQLSYLNENRSFLSDCMNDLKNSPSDCSYKDKIKWSGPYYYWSSTEGSSPGNALFVAMGTISGIINYKTKDRQYNVRAVLAF